MPTMDGYVRVSKVGDREGESYRSPALQEDEIRRWAEREGVTLGPVTVEEDVSGTKAIASRKLSKLIERAADGATEGVIVYALDRFGRDELDAALAIKRLRDVGARVVSATEGIDSSRDDPASKMALKLHLMFAEAYADRVGSNWKKATLSAAAAGIHCGKAPIGYRRRDEVEPEYVNGKLVPNGRLLPDPDTRGAVVEAFDLRARGASYKEASVPIETALGRRISRNTLARMVESRTYLGEIRRGGQVTKEAHEAIITPELFAAAKRKGAPRPKGEAASDVLLPGLVLCGGCGGRMKVQGGRGGRAYVCQPGRVGNPCNEPAAAKADAVDALVESTLLLHFEEAVEASGGDERRWLEARARVEDAEADLASWLDDPELTKGMKPENRTRAILAREKAVEEARAALYQLPDPELPDDTPILMLDGKPVAYEVWGEDREADRRVVRKLVGSVVIDKADPARRRWQPISERVRVNWRGA